MAFTKTGDSQLLFIQEQVKTAEDTVEIKEVIIEEKKEEKVN